MTKLTRLKINKFRNVEPVELSFSRGMNVLLGINGSGKTTFLELIAGLLSQNISRFRDEAFSVEYELSIAGGTIRVHLENQSARREQTDEPWHRAGPRRGKTEYALRSQVTIDIPTFPLIYSVDANRASIQATSKDRAGNDGSKYSIETPADFEERFLDCAIDVCPHVDPSWAHIDEDLFDDLLWFRGMSRFDESLRFWDLILADADEHGNEGWIHAYTDGTTPPVTLYFDNDSTVGNSLISALIEIANKSSSDWRGSETISLPMRDLPFLLEMARFAQFKDAKLELKLVEKNIHSSEYIEITDYYFGMLRFWFEKVDGSIIPDQKLSYGQKRLLSFFYYLDCNPTIVVADELAAGLHHAWISACLEAIGDRQAFLASHDPILIDEIDLSSIEDVERSFLLCRCDTASGKERLSWSNMPRYDAERFFEAYNVGLQHVSEILRNKRLW